MTVEEFAQTEKVMSLMDTVEPRICCSFSDDQFSSNVLNYIVYALINRLCTLGDIDFCRQFLTGLNIWFEYIE